jgi:hypothetical protein
LTTNHVELGNHNQQDKNNSKPGSVYPAKIDPQEKSVDNPDKARSHMTVSFGKMAEMVEMTKWLPTDGITSSNNIDITEWSE